MGTKFINKWWVYLFLSGSCLILCLAGYYHVGRRPLRLAIHPWIGYQSLVISALEHRLDPDLVQITPTPSLSASADMLLKDGVDAAALTLAEVVSLRDKGMDLTIVLIFNSSDGADLLLARPNITRLEELNGATIGMENSILGRFMLDEILHHAGLTRKDISLRFSAVAQHEQLWQDPEIDAIITYLPLPKALQSTGKRLFDSSLIPGAILDVLAIRTERMDQFEQALRHTLQQHFSFAASLRARSPDTLQRTASILNLDMEQTRYALSKITFPGVAHNYILLSGAEDSQLQQSAKHILSIMHPHIKLTPSLLRNLTCCNFLPEYAE